MSTLSDSVFLPNGSGENYSDSFLPPPLDRYARFLIYIKNAIEDISSGVDEDVYVYHLGKLKVIKSRSAPGKMQRRMRAGIMENLTAEIEEAIKQEKIKENLEQLDKLVDQSVLEEGKIAWRPNGNVNDHMRSHLMELKLKHKDRLEKIVQERKQEVECAAEKVKRLRTHIRSLESRLHMLRSQCADHSVVDKIDKNIIEKVENFEGSLLNA